MSKEMEGDDIEFHQAGSGASATYPVQCSALRKNGYVMIKGRPCKVMEMSTSKTGKHGHAKVHLVALDIFTQKKYEDLCPSTHNIDVPNVTRQEYTVSLLLVHLSSSPNVSASSSSQLMDITNDGFVSLMADNADTREDLRLPEGELGDKIREEFEKGTSQVLVTVMSAVGEEQIVAVKTGN
jgi:translation initiation factor 5A